MIKSVKGEPKASDMVNVTAMLLLGCGYLIALNAKGLQVVAALFPVAILVIIGTYLFFTQLSVYIGGKVKSE